MKRKKNKIRVYRVAGCNCFNGIKSKHNGYKFPRGVRFLDTAGSVIEEIFSIIGHPKYLKGKFKKQHFSISFCPICGKKYNYQAYDKNSKIEMRSK